MAQITEVPARGKRKGPMRELLETIVVALVIALVVRSWVVEVFRVEGPSMERTLYTGERLLVNKFIYRWVRSPRQGDVVIFQYPRQPERAFVKRVVATAGDSVAIKAGKVYVNGTLLPEALTTQIVAEDLPEVLVPPDSVWVLGDNRNNSEDSRFFHEVPLQNIRGLAFARLWPLSRTCYFVNPLDLAAGKGGEGVFACR